MFGRENLKIDEEIIKSADLCPKDKACLKNPKDLCPVISCVSDDMLLVSKNNVRNCDYHIPFGYNGFCKCPVRQAIYKKYKK
jgi:hypothetical protein